MINLQEDIEFLKLVLRLYGRFMTLEDQKKLTNIIQRLIFTKDMVKTNKR